jgi:amino acid adenylation domain-containing protein
VHPLSNGAARQSIGRAPAGRSGKAAKRQAQGVACLHRLFEAQALRSPGSIALTIEQTQITYGDLNARADRLARKLRGLGVGPEVLVGIYAERSAEMIVGLLAVLKAGGAYVPLDPAYPAERLGLILDDARMPILLTQTPLLERLPEHESTVILLDDPSDDEPGSDHEPLEGEARPGNLAYVIYTSGSTGRPKGVAVTHANGSRLLTATRSWFDFNATDVWSLFHSFAFDFSVWEIWGALAFGGRLVIVPYWVSRSPEAFLSLLRDERVTVLNQTPSAFRQLVHAEADDPHGPRLSLRLVIFGGEALELQSLRPWFDRHGDSHPRLINMYGITETTVHVTYRPISASDLDAGPTGSPIGVPIPDLRIYLLDPRLEPVPIGVVGEIYVGGAGLARGYLDDPELTADRFIPDPFGSHPGARLYKSGDLARRRPDGELDYIGRSDHQVKIRGFRIELGEIETALRLHPDVREAIVLLREDAGDRKLIAYIASKTAEPLAPIALRDWLKSKLPVYMIPSAFVFVERIPLTAHGKTDRAALLAIRPDAASVDTRSFVAPRTDSETKVAAAWASVLGLEQVGADDNFFDLGGHSLLATQAASRLRDAFGVDVPVRLLFEAPTVASLAARLETRPKIEGALAAPPIRRVARDSASALSFAQESLWYLDQLATGEAVFNVSAALRIVGPLDISALERSLNEVVRRHESLRTTFAAVDGRPVQILAPALAIPLETVDLTGYPIETRNRAAEALAEQETRRPFDLSTGPLIRASLFLLGERDHAVLLTMHHIITDGWSFGVAAAELATIYAAFREGHPSPLPEPSLQYADYSAWQRNWLQGEVLDTLLGYWRGQLGAVRPLELPTDRPRPPVRSTRGDLLRFTIPRELSESLNDLGRREGATPFMVVMAAFQLLLARTSGQDSFAIGSPIANRNRGEVESMIGYFINMIAFRADLSADPTFRTLLARVREAALGAYEHQDLPLELLVEALHPERDLSRTPLFQAMFVLQNNTLPDVMPAGLTLEAFGNEAGTGTAKFDLSLAIAESSEGFVGSFEYSTDLFDPSTMDRMLARFLTLLEAIVANPEQRGSEIDLTTDADRRSFASWNATEVAVQPDTLLHSLFEIQADQRPDAIAVVHEGRSLTYRELDQRSERLARRLQAIGVGPEACVGIRMRRSLDLAVAMLGTLKAGAAYLPLDPAYPTARLEYMIADANVRVLLTDTDSHGEWNGVDVLYAEADHDIENDSIEGRLALRIDPDHPAYVIYTSGSTGVPRGVVVSHRSVVNHALASSRMFGLTSSDRVLQFASLSFDIAVEEIFPAWSSGAAVVFRGDDLLPPVEFSRWIEGEAITVLDLPTAYWHAWTAGLKEADGCLPERLRLVVVGGEEALTEALTTWRELGGDRVRWINTYGPTEATVIATAYEPPAGAIPPTMPIGGPIANVTVHVLDDRLQPQPIGVAGELTIGGAGVARGYLGRPGLTAERFLPDPFGKTPGARLYRTGDLARWRPDGTLEFLGRSDGQVKVRGHRVEPGEVESAILGFTGVREAVVTVRDGSLIAYVVGRSDGEIDINSLRHSLKERLPRHLLPSAIIVLPALPMTPSGKVDRASLPEPDGKNSGSGREIVAPRDEVESRLVAIWEEILSARPIGVTDDFFDLGGHSMLAVRLLARIEENFGRTLRLTSLFRGATIADLATILRASEGPDDRAEPGSPLVAIQTRGLGQPFFCVHPAGGIVYCFQELARRLDGQPFYGLQSDGIDDDRPPISRLDEMAARYVEAIRRIQPDGPYHLGGWSLGGLVAFEMARQLSGLGEEVATVALIDTEAPTGTTPEVSPKLRALAEQLTDLEIFDRSGDPLDDAVLLAAFGDEMAQGLTGGVRGLLAHLRRIAPDARREFLLRHLKLDRVYHLETGPERVSRLLKVLRANLLAGARYAPTTPFAGRLTVFRAADRVGGSSDPAMGWSRLAGEGVTTRTIPGDHYTILATPGVQILADALSAELRASGSNRS